MTIKNPVQKKFNLIPKEYDEVSLVDAGAGQHSHVVIFKRSTDCGDVATNSTGAKDGKSERSKKFDESKHPRKDDGTMDTTSAASKKAYGKDGTTAANRDDCDDKDKKKSDKKKSAQDEKTSLQTANRILANRKKRKKKVAALATKHLRDAEAAIKKSNGKVIPMSRTIEKRKVIFTCADCDTSSDEAITKCDNCNSEEIKKSLVIVRKTDVPDGFEDIEKEDDEGEDEEDEDDEDEEDVPPAKVKKTFKKKKVEDDDEEEDEEEDVPSALEKSDHARLGLEVFSVSTSLAEDIHKVFTEDNISKRRAEYESVMTQFNEVMDSAAAKWFSGSTISKSLAEEKEYAAEIQKRLTTVTGGNEMKTRPEALISKIDGLPDDVRAYVENLEGGNIEKSDPYADLPEAVQKSLKAADSIVESNTAEKWENVAKSYSHFPGDKGDLAKTLRSLSEANPEAFTELKKTLDAAEHNLEQSDIFKSFGSTGHGASDEDGKIAKREADAKELVSKGEYDTIEQAEVALMSGSDYEATAK